MTLDRTRGALAKTSRPGPLAYPPAVPAWAGPDTAFLLDAEFDDAEDWLAIEPTQRMNRAILAEEIDLG